MVWFEQLRMVKSLLGTMRVGGVAYTAQEVAVVMEGEVTKVMSGCTVAQLVTIESRLKDQAGRLRCSGWERDADCLTIAGRMVGEVRAAFADISGCTD